MDTNDNKPLPGVGDVSIKLVDLKTQAEEPFVLKPSLHAAMHLSRQAGGILNLIRRCEGYDFDTINMVVAFGLGYTGTGPKELPGRVFATGMTTLAAPCITYLYNLANGGRPMTEADARGDRPTEGSN